MMLGTLPTDHTPRPIALTPIAENIPAELKARAQWVLWRYEWVVNKQGIGKWTKVPYGARDVKAATNRPTSWQSFDSALARYQANRDYFDGIGYVFAKDDPYVGGDIDHCIVGGQMNDFAQAHLSATYAEISPSGDGVKFIARATGDYGTKKPLGELYSSKRFFTITGRVLPGHEQITEQEEAVKRFYAAIGARATRTAKGSGGSANGSRAELVRAIPEETWEAARQLSRTNGERTERRVRAAAVAGGKEHSLLALLLAGDYTQAHERYPGKNIYRADGTLDESQVRFWTGQGIYARGFTFVEYIVAMSRLCGAAALAKWGNKELWRQELVAMWDKYPNYTPYTPRARQPGPKAKRTPRGRAGSHTALVEQVYSLLVEHQAGAEAIVKTGEIAGVIYCARETVSRIIAELRAAGRIATRPLPRHGGLVITFLGVIYSDQPQDVSPHPTAPNPDAPAAAIEETKKICVSSDHAEADHSLPPLPDLAGYYLSQRPAVIGEEYAIKRGSQAGLIVYRRTAKHFAALVTAEYSYSAEEATAAYAAEQQRLKDIAAAEWRQFFDQLRAMSDDELITYIGGRCRTEVAEMARDGSTFDKHLYSVRLKCARQHLQRRGLTMPSRKTRIEQAAVEAAANAQAAKARLTPPKARMVACQPIRYEWVITEPEPWRSPDDRALLAGLFARQSGGASGD